MVEPVRRDCKQRKVWPMQVTETLSEGLKREYKVVVPAAELESKVNARLDQIKTQVRINGFRPGKVPVAHLKRMYGRSTMAEVIENTVRDTNNQIVSERGFKLAADPKVTLPEEKEAVEQLIEGKSDLNYTVAVEIVPLARMNRASRIMRVLSLMIPNRLPLACSTALSLRSTVSGSLARR